MASENKSKFQQEAEAFAGELGKEPESFLGKYREAVRSPRDDLETRGCLEPYEIEQYVKGEPLAESRQDHLLECSDCETLAIAAKPSTELRETFLEVLREELGSQSNAGEAAIPPVDPDRRVVRGRSHRPPRRREVVAREALSDGLSIAIPIVAILLVVYSTFTMFVGSDGALRMTQFLVAGGVVIIASAVLVWLLGSLIVGKNDFFMHSGGAMLTGMGAAVVVGIVTTKQLSTNLELSSSLAQQELEGVALGSLSDWVASGTFTNVTSRKHLVLLSTTRATNREAIYLATATGFPGAMVARIQTDTGELWWERADSTRVLRARFVAGTVMATNEREFVLAMDDNSRISIVMDMIGYSPSKGSDVAVVLRPETNVATSWALMKAEQ